MAGIANFHFVTRYGLIGKSLTHSFSKKYFTNKFRKEKIAASYELYPLPNLEALPKLIENNNLRGLNVTFPYKELVIPYLDKIDATAKTIGAINTILFSDNQLIGYNTDIIGFTRSIASLLQDYHSKALILGTGGAAKAVAYALNELEVYCTFVSRTPQAANQIGYPDLTEKVMNEFLLIINTTPVGTYPDISSIPNIPTQFIGNNHLVYDLVYNPEKTALLDAAKQNGAQIKNGREMLEIQAEESWKIWQS